MNEGIQIAQRGSARSRSTRWRARCRRRFATSFFRPTQTIPATTATASWASSCSIPARGDGRRTVSAPVPSVDRHRLRHQRPERCARGRSASGPFSGCWPSTSLGARIMGRAAAAAGAGLLARQRRAGLVRALSECRDRDAAARVRRAPGLRAGASRTKTASLRPSPRCCSCSPLHAPDRRARGGLRGRGGPAALGQRRASQMVVLRCLSVLGTLPGRRVPGALLPPYFAVPLGFVQNLRPTTSHSLLVLRHSPAPRCAFVARQVPVADASALGARRPDRSSSGLWRPTPSSFARATGGWRCTMRTASARSRRSTSRSYGLAAALVGFALVAASFPASSATAHHRRGVLFRLLLQDPNRPRAFLGGPPFPGGHSARRATAGWRCRVRRRRGYRNDVSAGQVRGVRLARYIAGIGAGPAAWLAFLERHAAAAPPRRVRGADPAPRTACGGVRR